ncbi:hypothetical protein IVB02_04310 [Bradyrhizobium sp. 166]|uniref:hypothetical protein n=1 Tax=Bradyrhizobium sp. 166 TaxID=2782638 RepID=UPI001FF9B076|nr:hypothetical protein [Bradyrhizobium sp. 166]MCK1600667.1 hypothetical protein [Bradyrhizobium sp. 166]
MLNALRLEINPFAGIKVEGVKAWKEDDERGFDPEQALTILSATVATPSHLISREMKAARRWVPWICAYTGARVNEITSLLPSDVRQIMGHWCFVLRPEVTKGKRLRRVPVHKHLLEQKFIDYVEQRRKAGKPLFYEPSRARGGKGANPQWHKVSERLGEWVRESLGGDRRATQPRLAPSLARDRPRDEDEAGIVRLHVRSREQERYRSAVRQAQGASARQGNAALSAVQGSRAHRTIRTLCAQAL